MAAGEPISSFSQNEGHGRKIAFYDSGSRCPANPPPTNGHCESRIAVSGNALRKYSVKNTALSAGSRHVRMRQQAQGNHVSIGPDANRPPSASLCLRRPLGMRLGFPLIAFELEKQKERIFGCADVWLRQRVGGRKESREKSKPLQNTVDE